MKIGVLFCALTGLAIGSVLAVPPSAAVERLLGQYFIIQKSLALDSMQGVSTSVAEIAKISRQAGQAEPQAKTQLIAIADAAAKFNSVDLKSARGGFGDLSDTMIAYLKASGAKTNPPYQVYCPMVKKNWLQPDKAIHNPYYGKEMPTCGQLVNAGKTAEQPMGQMDMPREHYR